VGQFKPREKTGELVKPLLAPYAKTVATIKNFQEKGSDVNRPRARLGQRGLVGVFVHAHRDGARP